MSTKGGYVDKEISIHNFKGGTPVMACVYVSRPVMAVIGIVMLDSITT